MLIVDRWIFSFLPSIEINCNLSSHTMVLLSDKIMASAPPSSNPLRDALSSAPTALAIFVTIQSVSSFLDAHLCAYSREEEETGELEGECSLFCRHISFFAYAFLVAYVAVLIDAGMYRPQLQS